MWVVSPYLGLVRVATGRLVVLPTVTYSQSIGFRTNSNYRLSLGVQLGFR